MYCSNNFRIFVCMDVGHGLLAIRPGQVLVDFVWKLVISSLPFLGLIFAPFQTYTWQKTEKVSFVYNLQMSMYFLYMS